MDREHDDTIRLVAKDHGRLMRLAAWLLDDPHDAADLVADALEQEQRGRRRPGVPLRLARYLAVVALVGGFDFVLRRWLGQPARITILCSPWVLFYAIFWSTFPG